MVGIFISSNLHNTLSDIYLSKSWCIKPLQKYKFLANHNMVSWAMSILAGV